MKKMFQENGIWVVIVSLLLTSVITLGSALFPNLTSPLSNVIGIVGSPFQGATSAFTGWVEGIYNYAFRYEQLEAKLEETEAALAEARSELRKTHDALAENEDLRAALGLVEEKTDLKLLDVTTTDGSSNSWESTITINKGSSSGVAVNDCVITGTGYLVGVVKEVGTNWAKLITVIDPNISISATVYRTGDEVMLESDLDMMKREKCMLTYLGEDPSFINGDEVLTTGANGTYPSGLVIGYVDLIQVSPSGLEQYAVVSPAVNLTDLGTLFVITDFDNQ